MIVIWKLNIFFNRIILDVLRLASKACVIKRQFKKAGLLIMQAVCLANEFFKSDSQPCYADTLMDYGFYLLNFDSIAHSVQIYNVRMIALLQCIL